jgi:tyrosine-specific transport protein
VVATSFGFHIIIPSLTTYLNRNVRQLKQVILIGSLIPLIVYIVWNFLTLGVIPVEGQNGLMEGYKQGANGAHLLTLALNNPLISLVARSFSIFAIVTSFLGVSLSLMHFLADGLKLKEAGKGKALLLLLTFIPPLLFTLFYPRAFLAALEYAGAFGVILLLGVLPILMVWKGRAVHQEGSSFTTWGGKGALALGLCFSLAVIGLEIANQLGLLEHLIK